MKMKNGQAVLTVKDLIKLLKNFDQDLPVFTASLERANNFQVVTCPREVVKSFGVERILTIGNRS